MKFLKNEKSLKTEFSKKLYYQIKKSVDISKLPEIKGYDFNKKFDFNEFVKSFSNLGIQATNLGTAITITETMIREKVPIFLSFTSNMVSSGVRDMIKFLVENKKVSVLCTSAGGVEEDAMKAILPFRVGDFNASGETLFNAGVERIGNIYTTTDHYAYFEKFITSVFEKFIAKKQFSVTPSEICSMIGKVLEESKEYECKSSYLYWAYKNKIPVYCPSIVDGAIGDIAYFLKQKYPELKIDILLDHKRIIDYTLQCEKTGAIILGGGVAKHYALNANIFKEGFDYCVYITTASEHDASDSGANQEEAVTWAKIKPNAPRVKVFCDASIAFPILVAGTFAKLNKKA
jgi:deoxyhypusine synthase